MRIRFFTDLMLVMFLVPLTFSRIFLDFLLSFHSFVVPNAFFDLLADFADSIFFVLRNRLSFLHEGPNSFVFFVSSFCFRRCSAFCWVLLSLPMLPRVFSCCLPQQLLAAGAADASVVVFPSSPSFSFLGALRSGSLCFLRLFFCFSSAAVPSGAAACLFSRIFSPAADASDASAALLPSVSSAFASCVAAAAFTSFASSSSIHWWFALNPPL